MNLERSPTIPDWNSNKVLPPIWPGAQGHDGHRSPYLVTMAQVCNRFATSSERVAILDGLLRFRADLYKAGITSGFQWLDGSFVEDIESLENRSPKDIDVVTFFNEPSDLDQNQEFYLEHYGALFNQESLKKNYAIDAYFATLGKPTEQWDVQYISYWYSMWSHRRDGLWKGFVQVDLSESQDSEARTILNLARGAQP